MNYGLLILFSAMLVITLINLHKVFHERDARALYAGNEEWRRLNTSLGFQTAGVLLILLCIVIQVLETY